MRRLPGQRCPLLFAALVALGGGARAQNFPPVPRPSCEPCQGWVGEPILFSGQASVDPDASPAPLTYSWDFADGSTAGSAAAQHAFSSPRAYPVTLTVSDGADSTLATVMAHVLAPPLSPPPRWSSPLAIASDGRTLWVANPDSDTVSKVEVSSSGGLRLAQERPVCRHPRTLSLDEVGGRLWVACQGDDLVLALRASSLDVERRISVGHEPFGVVAQREGGAIVSNQGDDSLSWISAGDFSIQTIACGDGPRAIAVSSDGAQAFVTHYISRSSTGAVSRVDLQGRRVIGTTSLVNDPGPDTASSGRGVPNLLSAAAIDPAGRLLWVGGLKSNTSAGQFRTGKAIAAVNWVRGLAAPVDVESGEELLPRRIDTNDADSVSAIAFSPNGRYAYLTHQGLGALSIYDLSGATLYEPGAGTTVPFESRVDTGDVPHAVVLSPGGDIAYVANSLSRDVVRIDVADPRRPRLLARLPVTAEPLSTSIANGKRLFYRSREPVHSKSNYVACASCHADGATSDGQVWDFTQDGEGLRNTTDLRGRGGMEHGPVHWSGNFDEIQDFENPIVKLFGGTGLAQDGAPPNPPLGAPNAGRSRDLDDLAAYVSSLGHSPRSPRRQAGGALSEAAARGEAIFLDPARRCTECHPPPRYTISALDQLGVLVDVGTLGPGSGSRLGAPLTGLDVPTLIGAWDGAPYLHDGSAATLRDVFRRRPAQLEAMLTSDLNEEQLEDLIAFIESVDAPAPPRRTCGCGSPGLAAPLLAGAWLGRLLRSSRRKTRRP